MNIYAELVNEFNEEKNSLFKGEEINKLELVFKGHAIDAVNIAKRDFNIELDFSEESVRNVEVIADAFNKALESSNPTRGMIIDFARKLTGYVGQVVKIRWGGNWKEETEYSVPNGPVLRVKDLDVLLFSKVYRRLTKGPEDDIWRFYGIIKDDLDGTSIIKNVELDELIVREKMPWFKRILRR